MTGQSRRLRCVFFGSSAFAVPSLHALHAAHDIHAVYTRPDRPSGRGLKLSPTPVKVAAKELGLDVFEPSMLDAAFASHVAGIHPELLACVAYGKILPTALIGLPTLAALNVHPSLLPEYRGAAPIQAALREGRSATGVTIAWMSPKLDAGDVALARQIEITPEDDYASLHDKLAQIGAQMLIEAGAQLASSNLPRRPQDDAKATTAPAVTKEGQRLRFEAPAQQVINHIRSLSPRPGAWMIFAGKRLKVLKARALGRPSAGVRPGAVIDADAGGPIVACGSGAIQLLRVIPEGKPPMSGADLARSMTAVR